MTNHMGKPALVEDYLPFTFIKGEKQWLLITKTSNPPVVPRPSVSRAAKASVIRRKRTATSRSAIARTVTKVIGD